MGKCVLDHGGLHEDVRKWLDTPGNHGGGTKCEEIVAASERANEALTVVANHGGGGPDRVSDKRGQSADNFSKLVTLYSSTGAVKSEYLELFSEMQDGMSGSPGPYTGETNLDGIISYAKQQASTRRDNQGINQLFLASRGPFAADTGVDTFFTRDSGASVNDRKTLYASARHLSIAAAEAFEALNVLAEYQKEYERISKDVSDAHEDRLNALKAKAQACAAVAQGRGDEVATGDIFGDVEGRTYTEWCDDGLTDDEQRELQGLIGAKAAGMGGAGELGTVGAGIAASQEPTKRTFKEQCLLLSNIVQFVEYRDTHLYTKTAKRLPYTDYAGTSGSINANACVMADREPWGFMNQLVQDPSFANFFDIETKFLSQLQPMIRLYKISTDSAEKEFEREIFFDGAYNKNFDGVLLNSNKRGFGVGIQNFTFSYEGSDPFAVKKSIKARLSIFASSFDDLLKPRGGYRYADLALKTGTHTTYSAFAAGKCDDETDATNIDRLNFRLKAVVGWAMPQNLKGATDDETRNLIDSVRNSFVTLNLTPTIHEFDIGDDGRVVFHIDYLAYVDEFFDDAAFNIFSHPTINKNVFKRRQIVNSLNAQCTEKSEEELKKQQEQMAVEIDNDKRRQLAGIITHLLDTKKVYFKSIPYNSLRDFNSEGPYWKFDLFAATPSPSKTDGSDGGIKDADTAVAESEKTKQEVAAAAAKDKERKDNAADLSETKVSDINMKEYIAFFYLSDLVDSILHNIDAALEAGTEDYGSAPEGVTPPSRWNKALAAEKFRLKRLHNNFKRFRILLGPIELIDVKTREYYTANIGDLPISTAYFMDWLTDKTLKRENVVYSLPIFLKDLVNNLIREFLNEDRCFDINMKQRVRMFQTSVSSYNKTGADEITTRIQKQRGEAPYSSSGKLNMRNQSLPILNVMGERSSPINTRQPNETYNYAVFYAGRTQPQDKMTGIAAVDSGAGIFHYVLGKDKGIVKNIQLSKTDSPGLKEVRFEQEGYDGLMQLREVYDATITCYGAPNVVPGTYLYIEPRAFAPSSFANPTNIGGKDLTKLGIGGYYMVIRSENSYGPGECETEITAKWVAQLGCGADGGNRDATGRRPATTKCSSA